MENNRAHPKAIIKTGLISILALVLCGILGYFLFIPKDIDVDAVTVVRGTFIQELRADGYFRSKIQYLIRSFAAGDLIEPVFKKVGERVKKGEHLAKLFWDKSLLVRSPIDGIVVKVFRDNIGPINRGDPIVELIDPLQLEVVAELLTTDAVKVKPGDPATMIGWGGQGNITGSVSRISKAGFTKLSALGVEEERTEVIVDLKDPSPQMIESLGNHFHTEVRLEIERINQVLKIPVGALIRRGEVWAVYLIIKGRAALHPIRIRSRSQDEVIMEEELVEYSQVILYPPDGIKDGSRVRIRSQKI